MIRTTSVGALLFSLALFGQGQDVEAKLKELEQHIKELDTDVKLPEMRAQVGLAEVQALFERAHVQVEVGEALSRRNLTKKQRESLWNLLKKIEGIIERIRDLADRAKEESKPAPQARAFLK